MSSAVLVAENFDRDSTIENSSAHRARILHLITSFEIGGTERQAVELLKRIDRDRFDIRLAVLRNEGPFYREIEDLFPSVPEFPLTSFYNRNALKQLLRLRKLLISEKIYLVHAHDFYSSLLGIAAARLTGVKVIACQRHLKLSDRRVHHVGTSVIHRFADRLLVNSDAIRGRIINQRIAHPRKITVIRNGVASGAAPRAEARSVIRRELAIDDNVVLVGMVARLDPIKGHRFFIEAASEVLRGHPDTHFVLIGDGPLRSEIGERLEKAQLSDRVHLLGDRSDAARLISGLDLLVLSSLHEGLPNAVLEAMAAGVPVVATAVGGTKELITDGETGFLAPPADSGALARQINLALMNRGIRSQVAAAARKRIEAEYGMERMVNSVERLYDELLKTTVI
jgi:L-malate glycosyltransferase